MLGPLCDDLMWLMLRSGEPRNRTVTKRLHLLSLQPFFALRQSQSGTAREIRPPTLPRLCDSPPSALGLRFRFRRKIEQGQAQCGNRVGRFGVVRRRGFLQRAHPHQIFGQKMDAQFRNAQLLQ